MTIKLVQKIKLDGQPCRKSAEVFADLKARGLLNQIHQVITADESNLSSEGYVLAAQHQVDAAPFFIVTRDDEVTMVYKAYHLFLKEIFNQETPEADIFAEILAQNPDLDFII
jgi:hypothetical protein